MSNQCDILIIEDEPSVSRAVEMICDEEGMSVIAVDNAAEAINTLEHTQFRLALCDIMMQGMDGFRFLEELDNRGLNTPVVMMTGYSTMENAVKSLFLGAVDYIPKPFTADELLTVIRRSLRSSILRDKAHAPQLNGDRTLSFVPTPLEFHRLGYVSWVRMEDEGTARIGVSDLFLKSVEGIQAFELSTVGEELVQGVPCAVATSSRGAEHGIMCPMSG